MSRFFALLGNTPALSALELTQLLGKEPTILLNQTLAEFELPTVEAAQALMNQLGGTIKIISLNETLPLDESQTLLTRLTQIIGASSQKPKFALAHLNTVPNLPSIETLKDALAEQGQSSRYFSGPATGLSAAILLHKKEVKEWVVFTHNQEIYINQTIAVQDIDSWTQRDRIKPYADRKRGMLPPKVARMLVNLTGLQPTANFTPTVYDPFCGSGTVLLEALMVGFQVLGSDLNTEAVQGSQNNIAWLKKQSNISLPAKIFHHDVGTKNTQIDPKSIDAIVTEPFMGKPTPQPHEIPNIFKGLEKLYLGAFKQWTHILKENGVVVMIFPAVEISPNKTYNFENLIDKLSSLGYSRLSGPVTYAREGAVIQRQISLFRFNQKV